MHIDLWTIEQSLNQTKYKSFKLQMQLISIGRKLVIPVVYDYSLLINFIGKVCGKRKKIEDEIRRKAEYKATEWCDAEKRANCAISWSKVWTKRRSLSFEVTPGLVRIKWFQSNWSTIAIAIKILEGSLELNSRFYLNFLKLRISMSFFIVFCVVGK